MTISDLKSYLYEVSPWMTTQYASTELQSPIELITVDNIEILMNNEVLMDSITMISICFDKWDHKSALELFYRYKNDDSTTS